MKNTPVIPAKAGIQVGNLFLNNMLKTWIPAFAGMTGVLTSSALARPLVTREVATIGRFNFEAGTSISKRDDNFGSPKNVYETTVFPFTAKLGFTPNMEAGFTIRHLAHRLEMGDARYSGSSSGQFAPEIKISPRDNMGVFISWLIPSRERINDDLPIANGHDVEALALFKLPTNLPIHFNIGYQWRGSYHSHLGVLGNPSQKVVPSSVFENRCSVEIPVRFHLNLLGELAYYRFGQQDIAGKPVDKSNGEAMDALVGTTWIYGGWNIGLGIGFGLLEERHTSFALTKGMGDTTYQFSLSYKLQPRKPDL